MATGRYIHAKGHRTQQHLVQSYESNVFGLLHDMGYYVAFFGKNYLLSEESLQKVDHWDERGDESSILAFLASPPSGNKPFVMLISTPGAAPPYVGTNGQPPAFGQPGYYSYYNNGGSMYSPSDIQSKVPLRMPQPTTSNKPAYHGKIRTYRQLDSNANGTDYFYNLNAVYLQTITQSVDGLLGKVLDALEANPTLNNKTAVIASSESGDFAGDFGLVDKWAGGLDDVLTHIPFVARIPGGAQGHVVSEQIQLFDVMPTMLELAGKQKTRNTHFARSLVPQLMGGKGDVARVVYAEAGFLYPTELEAVHSGGPAAISGPTDPKSLEYPRYQEEMEGCPKNISTDEPNYKGCVGSPRATMARTLSHKIVYRPDGVSEFYDLAKDPRELTNLWNDPAVAAVQHGMLTDLLQWYQETTDVTPIAVDSVGYPSSHLTGGVAHTRTEPFWWEKYNPHLHPELNTHAVDGTTFDSWLE
jgi:choline-sulfatase